MEDKSESTIETYLGLDRRCALGSLKRSSRFGHDRAPMLVVLPNEKYDGA